MHTTSNPRRRRIALLAAATIAAGSAIGVTTLVSAATANAARHPDLRISQRISGSTTKGHTFDTITVKNKESASASHANILIYTTTSSGLGELFSTGAGGVCEVMPAPKGYGYAAACQVPGSI